MLKNSNITNETAIANQSEALGSEPISKYGRNLKSLKSRKNRNLFIFFILLTSIFIFSFCSFSSDPKNLIETMSTTKYRELNKMLSEVNMFPGLSGMADEENLILFGAFVAMNVDGDLGEQWGASKEAVEAILSRYFGVEKIFHKKSSLYRSWPDVDVDYPIDGVGETGNPWANVTKLIDAGKGTFVADVDLYYSFGMNWDDSWFGLFSQWKLKNGSKILNTDPWDEDGSDPDSIDIYRVESCRISLKPFVYKGKDTWQIIGVNGVDVPKILFP